MLQSIQKHLFLYLAFFLPIAFLFVIAATIYLPSSMLKTNYNFIYAVCNESDSNFDPECSTFLKKRFSVKKNRLQVHTVVPEDRFNDDISSNDVVYTARIFLHNTATNESREVTIEEAQSYELTTLLTSPDGITLTHDYSSNPGVFPIIGSNSSFYGYYLTKGNAKKKMDLINSGTMSYYRDNVSFIGWVVN